MINGEFDIERVMRVTEEYCPVDFTEEEVNEIALAVLDKLLADGVVYIDSIDEKDQKIAYKTIFSFEHKQEE